MSYSRINTALESGAGGSVFALVTVGQNVDKTVASDQGQCRVTFKDLS